jgi:hypothetical protein
MVLSLLLKANHAWIYEAKLSFLLSVCVCGVEFSGQGIVKSS